MNALNLHQHSSEHSLDHHQLISSNQTQKTINQLDPINPLFQHNPSPDQLALSGSFISSPSLNSPASSAATTILNSSASSSNSSKPSTAHLNHLNLNHSISFSSSTTTPPPPSQIKRKFNATLEQKILILDWHHANGKKQTKTAAHFTALDGWPTITQPLISNWLKDEEKIRANLKLATPDTKRLRTIRHPDVEQALSIWCNQAIAQNIQLGYEPIRCQARQFAVALGIDEAEFARSSNSWIDRFLERQAARTIKTHNSDNLSPNAVEAERLRIRALSAYYPPQDIWSFDETSLYYSMPPDLSIPTEKWSSEQQLLTFAFAVNADSSERRPPSIIGHSQAPRNGKPPESLGFDYGWNPKACVTPEMFIRTMLGWQKELARHNRKILLLIDNNPGHIVESELYPNIRIEFISSNMSAFLQPLDQGIVRVWKANYRRLFLRRALELHEAKKANIYEIDQLEAMHLANTAWSTLVPNGTILSCWRRTDLLISDAYAFDLLAPPDVGDHGVALAEAELAKTIDLLVERGLLNASNRIGLEEYSDPACERIVMLQRFTDTEIIALVRNEDGRRAEVARHHDEECKEDPDKASNPAQMSKAASNGLVRASSATHRPAQQAGSHSQHFQPPAPRNLVFPHSTHTAHLGSGELSSFANEQVKAEEHNEEPAVGGGNASVWTVPQVLEAFEEIGRFSMMRRGEKEWAELLHVMAKASLKLRGEWENAAAGLGGQTAGQVQVQAQTRPGPHPVLHAHPPHGQLAGPPSRRQGSTGSLGHPVAQPRPQSQPHQIAHSQAHHHAPHAHSLPHVHHTQLHYQQTAGIGPQQRPQSALPHASMGFHRQQHPAHLSQLSPQGHQAQHHSLQQQQHRSSLAQQHQHHLQQPQQQQTQQSPAQQMNHHSPAPQTNHHGSPLQTNHQAHLQAEQTQQQQEQLQQAQTSQQQAHTPQYSEPQQSQTPQQQQQQTPQHQQQPLQSQPQQLNHHHHQHQHHQQQHHHQPTTGHSQLSIDAITHPVNVNSN